MEYLFGCKRKEKRTISSRLTNLRLAKRRACLVKVPAAYSIKDKFHGVYSQKYGNCTSAAVLGCDDAIYHTEKWDPSLTFTYYNQIRTYKPIEDAGSDIETALKMVKKYGVCSSKVWPNDEPFDKKPSEEAYENGLHGKEIKKWYEVKSLEQIKQAIYRGYPVVISVEWAFKEYDGNFVMNTPTKQEAFESESCHAIVIVGYDDEKNLFEFRNSWSEQWGNNGYAYFTYRAVKNCALWDDTYAVIK